MSQQASGLNQTGVVTRKKRAASPKGKHCGLLSLQECRDLSCEYGALTDSQLERLRDQVSGLVDIAIARATDWFEKQRGTIPVVSHAVIADSLSNDGMPLLQ